MFVDGEVILAVGAGGTVHVAPLLGVEENVPFVQVKDAEPVSGTAVSVAVAVDPGAYEPLGIFAAHVFPPTVQDLLMFPVQGDSAVLHVAPEFGVAEKEPFEHVNVAIPVEGVVLSSTRTVDPDVCVPEGIDPEHVLPLTVHEREAPPEHVVGTSATPYRSRNSEGATEGLGY